jgi:hypothetical protein
MAFVRFRWLAFVGLLILAVGNRGHAQGGRDSSDLRRDGDPVTFRGLINDHTIATAGSWEVHGVWTLDLKGRAGKADFLAELTMERADYWFLTNPNPPADPNSLTARNAHTHHIGMTDALVTALANGFRVSGAATLTGNGATPPFGTSSTVQLDVTGGDLVTYSNIAMTFGGDAVTHFGPNPLAGVVSVKLNKGIN